MKLMNKLGLLVCLIFAFSGCSDTDYEDKDLTNFFIQNNKEKLNKIYELETQRIKNPFDRVDREENNGELRTFVSLSFFEFITFTINKRILGCDYPMIINSTNLKFQKANILTYGKESMYIKAEKCLNAVLEELDKNKIADLNKIEREIEHKKEIEFKLNKKFNPDEIKSE